QLVIEEPAPADANPPGGQFQPESSPRAPTRRYNALGVLEDVVDEGSGVGTAAVEDVGPAETPTNTPAAVKRDPLIVGAGRARSMGDVAAAQNAGPVDWSSVGRNDPCPCGSGKKFKKCHGANM